MVKQFFVALLLSVILLTSCVLVEKPNELFPGDKVRGTRADVYKGLQDGEIVIARWVGAWSHQDIRFAYTEGMDFAYRGEIYENVIILPSGRMVWD